jgi:hypothetical protein
MTHLTRQNSTGCDIVAVAKAARQTENLRVISKAGSLDQPVNVDALRFRASLLESEFRFQITVRSRGSQDQYVWLGHDLCRIEWMCSCLSPRL